MRTKIELALGLVLGIAACATPASEAALPEAFEDGGASRADATAPRRISTQLTRAALE